MVNVNLTVSALIENSGSVGIASRVQQGGWVDSYNSGYFFSVDNYGNWNFSIGYTVSKSGKISFSANQFYQLMLISNSTEICAYVDGSQVACITDKTWNSGFSAIGTGWNYAQFDDFYLNSLPFSCPQSPNIVIATCSALHGQSWIITPNVKGLVQLNNTSSKLCLQVNGTDPNSGSPSVRALPCDLNNPLQQWLYTPTTSQLTTQYKNSQYCLDVTNQLTSECSNVEIFTCNEGQNQNYYYNPDNGNIVEGQSGFCISATEFNE